MKDFIEAFKANWKAMLIYGAVCIGIGFMIGGGIIGKIVAAAMR